MVDPSLTQLVGAALAAPDPSAWCNQHRAHIDGDFLSAAKQQLDAALQSGTGEAFALGDLVSAAAPMVEYGASLDFFTRLSEDLERAKVEWNAEDSSDPWKVFG